MYADILGCIHVLYTYDTDNSWIRDHATRKRQRAGCYFGSDLFFYPSILFNFATLATKLHTRM